jgi:PTH1 family peptidyl-tRNA hydrolase
VQKIANFYKIEAKDLLVIHDDIDLTLWTVKLKTWGWLAGHNWLKSIAEKIWTQDFSRIRIWVGRPSNSSWDVADYVLWNFKKEEIETIQNKYLEIDRIVLDFIE